MNDPCKAVYYYSAGGERHAFPNEKVYFTWYQGFDDVVIVTDDFMASISLGANVTYHPGKKMVTFQSTHDVYAVEIGSVLRLVMSEEIAEAGEQATGQHGDPLTRDDAGGGHADGASADRGGGGADERRLRLHDVRGRRHPGHAAARSDAA